MLRKLLVVPISMCLAGVATAPPADASGCTVVVCGGGSVYWETIACLDLGSTWECQVNWVGNGYASAPLPGSGSQFLFADYGSVPDTDTCNHNGSSCSMSTAVSSVTPELPEGQSLTVCAHLSTSSMMLGAAGYGEVDQSCVTLP